MKLLSLPRVVFEVGTRSWLVMNLGNRRFSMGKNKSLGRKFQHTLLVVNCEAKGIKHSDTQEVVRRLQTEITYAIDGPLRVVIFKIPAGFVIALSDVGP